MISLFGDYRSHIGADFNKQNKILQKLHRAHKTLIDMVLKGSDLIALCCETSRLINNPVAIIDKNGILYLPHDDPNLSRFENLSSEET